MNGLTIRDLGASYGRRRVLTAVDLNLAAGEMLAVLGPSGCGKTTLLRSIAGLHPIDNGRIELDGRELARPPAVHVAPEHRHIGLMPQEGGLFPHLSVGDNVGFGLMKALQHRRIGDRAARLRRVHEMLDLVGLADAVNARPNELSGGQQQRIALARALAPAPSVVLMDEPFASL
ncbi:MAG: ABC transporter ATP-binding protein, partial [Rhodococcus sp. (in: high G+C Gram-positive bacteria)]